MEEPSAVAATSVDAELAHNGAAVQASSAQQSEPKGSEKGTEQKEPANTPATGLPTISGTVQVGQVLTADTSAIADADGTANATFTYQWIAGTADITGATGSSHTLTSGDQGRSIKVKVRFTDDAGNIEELISAATFAVAPPPLTATIHDASDSHDGQTAFTFKLRLSEESSISYKTLRDHAFTETGVEVVPRQGRLEQGSNISWEITVQPDGDDSGHHRAAGHHGLRQCNRRHLHFGRQDAFQQFHHHSAGARHPEPTGSGGEQPSHGATQQSPARPPSVNTLSVSMAEVSDENGMTGASHSYQWMADDVNIQGATGATYTLADGDEGKAIKSEGLIHRRRRFRGERDQRGHGGGFGSPRSRQQRPPPALPAITGTRPGGANTHGPTPRPSPTRTACPTFPTPTSG